MSHIHEVLDADKHFIIDPCTGELVNYTPEKNNVRQFAHNSERLTFELPRIIEGHDMSTCNIVEVHFINVDAKTSTNNPGLYPVTDLTVAVNANDEEVVKCSWLISKEATQLAGPLLFRLNFICSNNGNIDYLWPTAIYRDFSVHDGISNTQYVVGTYPDVLAAFNDRLRALEVSSGSNVDLSGYVKTVNGVGPDANGNVNTSSSDSGQNLSLTSPNGTIYTMAVKDDGTLYAVKQDEEPGEPEEPDTPDEPVEPDVPEIEWHTITADEITGINADRRLIATYTGTAENILIPATLDGKPVVMNTAPNAPFDTNGVIKNIRIENGVGGTFQANPSEAVYGLGNIQTFRAGTAVKRIVIDSDNPDCTEFNCSGATALEEVHGLHHLTALTNGSMMFKGTAIQKLDAYPPKLSNAKLMFWQCSNLETVPDISMELSDCNNMFLQCTKLSEVTVSAMKGCDITMIGGSSPNGGNFTFRCNYGSSLYESFRGMICHSMNSKENLFIELLDNYPVEDIVMWGDSMTKAGNTTMGNMPDQLAEMVTDHVMVWNYGYSGNTIQACATRFNNHPEKWGDTTVIWLGTNNTAMSGGDMTALIQSEFISKLTTDNYVVVGLLTTNYSDEKNAAFASAFGEHFLDIRGYFLEHMWEISGLTATEQDESDIANGLIPSSFRVDVTHLNPAGGRIVATAIREKLLDMGYIGGCGSDSGAQAFTPFGFVQISDSHASNSQSAIGVFVRDINMLTDVDFVTNSGDITLDQSQDDDIKRAELAEYKAILRDPLNVPIYPCVGGHDLCESMDTIWPEYTGMARLQEIEHKGCVILLADCLLSGWLDWLEERVAANTGKRIYIYEHHPIENDEFTVGLKAGETRVTWGDNEMRRILRLLRNNHNVIWFTGHTHWPFKTAVNDVYNDEGRMGAVVHTPYLNALQGWMVEVGEEATMLRGVEFAEGGMRYLGGGYDYAIIQDITDYGEAEIITEGETVALGGTVAISVYLAAAPRNNQTVHLIAADGIGIDKTELVFTPANYAAPQTVTVSGNAAGTGKLTLYSRSRTTVRKIDVVAGAATVNYFNKNKPLTTLGSYYGTGSSASYQLSNPIPAKTGDHVRSNALGSQTTMRLKMFDADFNYVAEAQNNVTAIDYTITEPGVAYVSVVYRGATAGLADTIMVTINQELPSEYVAYNGAPVGYTITNYADPDNPSVVGGYYNEFLTQAAADGTNVSNLFAVAPGDTVRSNNPATQNYLYLYDSQQTLIERVANDGTPITNPQAAYAAVCYATGTADLMVMVNQRVPGYYVEDTDTM